MKIVWEDPTLDGGVRRTELTQEEAISMQKDFARTLYNYQYESDNEALADFMTVNFAWKEG